MSEDGSFIVKETEKAILLLRPLPFFIVSFAGNDVLRAAMRAKLDLLLLEMMLSCFVSGMVAVVVVVFFFVLGDGSFKRRNLKPQSSSSFVSMAIAFLAGAAFRLLTEEKEEEEEVTFFFVDFERGGILKIVYQKINYESPPFLKLAWTIIRKVVGKHVYHGMVV